MRSKPTRLGGHRRAAIRSDCPHLVATIGLHGSASAWVFNVVRELMTETVGEAATLTAFADAAVELPDAAARAERHLLIKSHAGSPQLDAWLAAEKARIILSIRDPRDSCLSIVQRFGISFDSALYQVTYDCARLIRLAAEGHAVLRYENRFFEDPGTVAELTDWLGLAVAPATAQTIFDRYRSEAVRTFVKSIPDLPPERLRMIRTTPADKVTYYLGNHIGDGRSRKWHALPIATQNELTRAFEPFLQYFDYLV